MMVLEKFIPVSINGLFIYDVKYEFRFKSCAQERETEFFRKVTEMLLLSYVTLIISFNNEQISFIG